MQETFEELESIDNYPPFFTIDNETYIGKVINCVDGDTCDCIFKYNDKVHKFRIRMYGYNTPELHPKKKTYDTEEEKQEIIRNANLAKDRLEELILDKYVYIDCKGFGDFGRLLADIRLYQSDNGSINKTLENKTINKIMLEEGLGVVYKK